MGIRCCYLRKIGRIRRQPDRRGKGAAQTSAFGAFSLGGLMPRICELPVSRIHDGRNYRFFVLMPLRIGLHKFGTGSQFRHENKKRVQSPLRLVGSMCKWRARARILRIGICRSEQKRSCAAKTADYPEKGDKSLLRKDHSVWHSTTMQSVRGGLADHRKPG